MTSSAASAVRGEAMSASAIVAATATGSHVLKIEGYSRTKGLGNGKSISSSTFDVGGHRWCIKYYPDGSGSNDAAGWISFNLNLRHADATDVKASIKFSLLDEMGEPVQSYTKCSGDIYTFNTTNPGWGYDRFIEKKVLEESNYLKDDCFRVRCDVIVSKEIRTDDTIQFVTVPPSDMHQHIGHLLSFEDAEADVTFRVGKETFDAHRLVLGARSSVFMSKFFALFKEKHTSHIQIDDMEPRVFKAMLHYIYTDSVPEIHKGDTLVMARHLLVAADRYSLWRLKLICEDKLCNCISTSTVATTLALAEQHGCKGLKEACFKFLRSPGNLKTIMGSDRFQHLTSSYPSLLSELLANVAP
ncbi:BTB/POZ and MATH domain-containing protein 2 [Dichanthelium oligosanthes]|uniref:BTB/POZ and MATH domain-containing protein 2 n=1 Tax=Dichanthelium oligosanthes TaxID=888268 RepID=A0A1E5USY1_9POAL|nr:BTB/POZ and MATH domain-containing protein 2 [Dichanthelium oligosanthes]